MNYNTIEQTLKAADIDSAEHDFIIDCLKAAVSYCKQQYADSCIDHLPSAATINLQEADKFDLLTAFLNNM